MFEGLQLGRDHRQPVHLEPVTEAVAVPSGGVARKPKERGKSKVIWNPGARQQVASALDGSRGQVGAGRAPELVDGFRAAKGVLQHLVG